MATTLNLHLPYSIGGNSIANCIGGMYIVKIASDNYLKTKNIHEYIKQTAHYKTPKKYPNKCK